MKSVQGLDVFLRAWGGSVGVPKTTPRPPWEDPRDSARSILMTVTYYSARTEATAAQGKSAGGKGRPEAGAGFRSPLPAPPPSKCPPGRLVGDSESRVFVGGWSRTHAPPTRSRTAGVQPTPRCLHTSARRPEAGGLCRHRARPVTRAWRVLFNRDVCRRARPPNFQAVTAQLGVH